jgi:glycosyltransferase involved in cell wall biosynthesis
MTDLLRLLDRRPRICLLSLSAVPDDPRVRRQGDAFHEAGWDVVAVSLPGWRSDPPAWPVHVYNADVAGASIPAEDAKQPAPIVLPAPAPRGRPPRVVSFAARIARGIQRRALVPVRAAYRLSRPVLGRARHNATRIAKHLALLWIRVNPRAAVDLCLQSPEIRRYLETAARLDADLYLANDWHMLPVAIRLAQERGVAFCYDTHEYAIEEYRYRTYFRIFRRPLARAVEGRGLREALVSSTVSHGIADDMRREYGLAQPLAVIRSVPNRQPVVWHPTGDVIRVLYHGIVVPDRGLEECIQSVALWRPCFRLVLRGPGAPEYLASLRQLAETCGVADRVDFAEPVKMTELICAASAADVGMSTPPKTSKHNLYALPNKFFEYVQAGLALCVCDLPDYRRLVQEHALGVLIEEVSPESIARAVNSLTPESIDTYKRNSAAAAEVLNWEREREVLVGGYTRALAAHLMNTSQKRKA